MKFRELLTGQKFRFDPKGLVFVREKTFFRTTPPEYFDRRSWPADMNATVHPVTTEENP